MDSQQKREARLSRRRERERRLCALATAEQKEAQLAKWRLRDRAWRTLQSTIQHERTVQQRRERLIHETPEKTDPSSENAAENSV